jgi:RimJ/RimL family protein N-acetyltransferase
VFLRVVRLFVWHAQVWGNLKTLGVGTRIGKRELRGKGLGREITVGLLEKASNQLNIERSRTWSAEYSRRAHTALKACGVKKGGTVRQAVFVNGE